MVCQVFFFFFLAQKGKDLIDNKVFFVVFGEMGCVFAHSHAEMNFFLQIVEKVLTRGVNQC